jgi:hypothetical protein
MHTQNRIQSAIHDMGTRLAGVSAAKRKRLHDGLTLDAMEHYAWQTCQSRAHAEGVITAEEAMTLYHAIQNWNEQPVEARIIVTESIKELLTQQIRGCDAKATAKATD